MKFDVIPKPKPEKAHAATLSDQWLETFRARKSEFLSAAFDDACDDLKALANSSLRMHHGLTQDVETYSALIEWAYTGVKPDTLSNSDVKHLREQGFVTIDCGAPSPKTLQVLGIQTAQESKAFEADTLSR